jgi:hypothetical protein
VEALAVRGSPHLWGGGGAVLHAVQSGDAAVYGGDAAGAGVHDADAGKVGGGWRTAVLGRLSVAGSGMAGLGNGAGDGGRYVGHVLRLHVPI